MQEAGETVKDIGAIAIDTRPTTDLIREDVRLMPDTEILEDNIAKVETKNFKVQTDKFVSNSGELVNLYIDASETITRVCFDFPIDVKDIEITEIKENVPYFIDTNIKTNEEKVNDNQLCYNTNLDGNDLYYKAVYRGKGTIKYNVTVNGIVLDPYLIGDDLSISQTIDNRLVLRLPFDGNSNAESSYIANTIPTSGLRYNESGDTMSYVPSTGTTAPRGNAKDPSYFLDNSWTTYARCSYQISYYDIDYTDCSDYDLLYLLKTNDTGANWQVKTDGSSPTGTVTLSGTGTLNITVPQTCIDYAKQANSGYLQLRTRATSTGYLTLGTNFQCYGYTSGWQTLHTATVSTPLPCGTCTGIAQLDLFEEALWITNSSNYTAYTAVTPKTQYYNVNGLVWSNSFGFYGNDSVSALKNDVNTSQTGIATEVLFNDSGANGNGTTSYINLNRSIILSNWSVSFTARKNNVDNAGMILTNPNGGLSYIWLSSNSLTFDGNGTAGAYACGLSSALQTANTKYTIQHNGTAFQFFYNGILNCTVLDSYISGESTLLNVTSLIGNYSSGYQLNGSISKIDIYNRSLSAEEVYIFYRGGNFSTNVNGEANKSIYLNGNEVIKVQNNTIPMGAYSTSQFTNYEQSNVAIWHIPTQNANLWLFTQYYYPDATINYNYTANMWRNILTTNNGTYGNVYINGVLNNSGNGNTFTNPKILLIGGLFGSSANQLGDIGYKYKGYLDEFNVYNYVLSQDEIDLLAGGFNNSLNIQIREAFTNELIQNNVNIEVYKTDLSYYKQKSTSTGEIYINGLGADTYKIFATSQNYTPVTYFYTIQTSNGQYNITLYMTNETAPEYKDVKFIVKDKSDDSILSNAQIDIYSLNNGNYTLVNQLFTNPNGDKTTSLIMDDVFYKFTVYYGSIKCYETVNPFTITTNDDTITLYCKLNSPFYDTTYAYKSINTTISFFNTSNETFYYSYQGTAVSGGNTYCWYLYKVGQTGDTLLNSSCTVGQNVLLTTNVVNTSTNTQDTTYYLKGCVTPANYTTPDCQFDYNTMKSGTGVDFTGIGLIITIGLALFAFFALIRVPQAAILTVSLIIAFSSALHFIKIPLFDGNNLAGSISILAIGLVLSFIITKRASP